MNTEFKHPGFISNLDSIPINELDKAPASSAVWFGLDKDKNVLYIGEAAKNLCFSLCSTQKELMPVLKGKDVSSIAYWLVDAKEVKNLTRKTKVFFAPPISNNPHLKKMNKSKIFVPAIKSLIKKITATETKTSINTQANFADNFLRNTEKTEKGVNVLSLEEILLSEFVNKDIFKEFIKDLSELWDSSKGCTNDKQQSKVNDNADLEEAVLDDSEKKKIR